MVFVGYGVVAPEFGWDDFKGVDVRGKTLVMLVGDPPVPDPANPAALDPTVFKGAAMTYYGRWTYKYEMAAKKGAAAAIIVHETGPAGYAFDVVKASWGRENFGVAGAGRGLTPRGRRRLGDARSREGSSSRPAASTSTRSRPARRPARSSPCR